MNNTLGFVGGALIHEQFIIHVNHYKNLVGKSVYLLAEDGSKTQRSITKKIQVSKGFNNGDLCLLKLNKPVCTKAHNIFNIVDIEEGEEVLIYRPQNYLLEPAIKKIFKAKNKFLLVVENKKREIIKGCSGHVWIKKGEDKKNLVSLTSFGRKGRAFGPFLFNFVEKINYFINNDKSQP